MTVKKIIAVDMRRALEMAREELGPDAIILSTQRHAKGIELHATVEEPAGYPQEQQAFASQRREAGIDAQPLASDSAWGQQDLVNEAINYRAAGQQAAHQRPFGGKTGPQLAAEIELARTRMLAAKREADGQSSVPGASVVDRNNGDLWASQMGAGKGRGNPSAQAVSKGSEDSASALQMQRLQDELVQLRGLLQQRLQPNSKQSTKVGDAVKQRLAELGIPAFQAERLMAAVNDALPVDKAWPEALALLSQRIPVAGKDIVEQGGVFAFVGPTGVGKTTTLSKLAVRFAMAHGTDGLALITTDIHRLAAHEQLVALGRVLSVPVKVMEEGESLSQVLAKFSAKQLVLIDTAGLRHGDVRLKRQLQQLREAKVVKSLLVMAANSQLQMLKASCHAYGAAAPIACILTKLDETPSLGEAIGMTLEQRLPLAYSTHGQEIPADIQVAKGHTLVARAAQLASQGALNSGKMAE